MIATEILELACLEAKSLPIKMQTETGARHHTGVDEANGIQGWPSPGGGWDDGFQSVIIRWRTRTIHFLSTIKICNNYD